MAEYEKNNTMDTETTPLINNHSTTENLQKPLLGAKYASIAENKPHSVTVNDVDTQTAKHFPKVTDVPQHPLPAEQSRTGLFRLRSFSVPRHIVNVFLSVCTVIGMVANVVVVPLYTGAFTSPETGSDAYLALLLAGLWLPLIFFAQVFFMKFVIDSRIAVRPHAAWSNLFVVGVMMATNGILQGFSSPPQRTPPHLQALLQTMQIPSTVLARLIFLRKGISYRQLGCLCCLFIGLFISLEPSIFQLDQPVEATNSGGPWYFTMMFGLSWLPVAVAYVFIEKGKKPDDDSMVYMAWVQVFLQSTIIFMMWTDFLPVIGMAKSPQDFLEKLKRGLTCMYGADPKCAMVPKTAAAFLLSYTMGNMFNLLLIRYAESAVYSVVVLALVTPLSTIFWTLFSPSPSLHWNPVFNSSTIYLLVGLTIMMPSVIMYTMFSNSEMQVEVQISDEEKQKKVKSND